ncbi:hypothetical protein NM688_g5623 [Phlebia brevispora]|uniref:Uncharacterized protein n=1 Tax=Phlebia brevispora TaxID=194682 RepID=A0ACC1SS85_9APHY|nr:hypothetical protein NM688_g5623 [Phlebia brevispora]
MIDDNFSDVPAEILRVSTTAGADWRGIYCAERRRDKRGRRTRRRLALDDEIWHARVFLPTCCIDQVLERLDGSVWDIIDNPFEALTTTPMSAILPMSSMTSTSTYLSDIPPQMHIDRDIFPDEKSFLLGAEQRYPDAASASNCIISPRGLFRVFRYHSFEGEGGVPVLVTVNFNHRPSETTYLRIVIGRRALNTTVRQISKGGTWELEAIVPHLDSETSLSPVVPITAQALTSSNGVLDAVTVGSYTYWTGKHMLCYRYSSDTESSTQCLRDSHQQRTVENRQNETARTATPTAPPLSPSATHTSIPTFAHNIDSLFRPLALQQGFERASLGSSPESHRAILELLTPLDTMCTNWDPEEVKAGRRLVRFSRSQEGYKVKLSCESINQDDYIEGDTVISCIYRRDADACFVTSVDIIFLLESIVGDGFEIEEKNRIRRNLEGFRPKTISKNRAGSESFFQQIMDFPAPKPRNIEKDVKVFEWSVLPQALEKIISKYTAQIPTPEGRTRRQHSGRPPDSIPTFSPTTSVSDIPDRTDTGDQFLYSTDSFDSGSANGAYNPHSATPHSIPFLARTETMGSYGSVIDAPSMMTSSSSSSDGGHISYHPVYRLIPPSQSSSMSDISMPSTSVFAGEDYHSFEDRIRSPVSYF